MKSLDELRAQKRLNYQTAMDKQIFYKLATVARELGEHINASYGPKYQFSIGDIGIYVDDYGNYMTVTLNGKKIASTHLCDQLFIPGGWIDELQSSIEKAELLRQQRAEKQKQEERRRLESQLSI